MRQTLGKELGCGEIFSRDRKRFFFFQVGEKELTERQRQGMIDKVGVGRFGDGVEEYTWEKVTSVVTTLWIKRKNSQSLRQL